MFKTSSFFLKKNFEKLIRANFRKLNNLLVLEIISHVSWNRIKKKKDEKISFCSKY